MRVLVYIGIGLWVCVGIAILLWNLILGAQVMNNRVQKPGQQPYFRSNNPADYTEIGQRYLKKQKRAVLAWFAYLPVLFILVVMAMSLTP